MPGFEDTLEAPCGRCGTLLSVCARVALHPLEPGVPAGAPLSGAGAMFRGVPAGAPLSCPVCSQPCLVCRTTATVEVARGPTPPQWPPQELVAHVRAQAAQQRQPTWAHADLFDDLNDFNPEPQTNQWAM